MGKVTCAMVEVSIASVGERRDELLESCFEPAEAAALRLRHVQSTAGALAAKRALCQLLAEVFPGSGHRERDVTLRHDEAGAPRVVGLRTSAPVSLERIAISITHTRRRALGLAACEEP